MLDRFEMFALHDWPVHSWWETDSMNFQSWWARFDFFFPSHLQQLFCNPLHLNTSFYHQLPIVHHHDRSSPTGRTARGMTVRSACPSRMLGTRGTRSVSVCIRPVLYTYFILSTLHIQILCYNCLVIIYLSYFWNEQANWKLHPGCIIKNWPVSLQLYLVGPQQASAAPLGQYLVDNQVLPASIHLVRLIPVL